MKSNIKIYWIIAITLLAFQACQDESFQLDLEFAELGTLQGPQNSGHIDINPESNDRVSFSWSEAKSRGGGLVLYRVLFDTEDGDFEEPIATFVSSSGGAGLTLNLTQPALNNIASEAGIPQLGTGRIKWTVEASIGYQKVHFEDVNILSLTRPEGIAILPEELYIFGSATESQSREDGVAFKRLSNLLPIDDFVNGVYESITYLKPGDFQIIDSTDDTDGITHFYINDEGKIRTGEQASSFEGDEGVYRIRLNLTQSMVSFEKIDNLELYILANGAGKAQLNYIGDHTFESTEGYFDFLTPGMPEAPSWLGWEEERYRFRFSIDGQTSYLGSNQNDDMNASLVSGLSSHNPRPNGNQPGYYHQVFMLGQNASYWQGAWKFADQFNGVSFTVRVVFDPKADNYYHEIARN